MIVFIGQIFVLLILTKVSIDLLKYFFSKNTFVLQGIPGPKQYPYIGTHLLSMIREGFVLMDRRLVNKYGRIIALKEGKNDCLLVTDPEFIKEVFIKQFDSFHERRVIRLDDKVVNQMLTSAEGETWKRLRTVMSPTFSSGKMKLMFNKIMRCSQEMSNSMLKEQKNEQSIDVKRLSDGFALDTIAAVAFGLELNSLEDKNSEFRKHGEAAFDSINSFTLRVLLMTMYPRVANLLHKLFGFENTFVKRESTEFFSSIVKDIISKTSPSDEAVDFIRLMIKATKENHSNTEDKKISVDELISQGILFFLAGFNTTSDTLVFLLYNLAMHPDSQEKIREEIREKCVDKDKATYEEIQQLKYMDCAIEESLRLYPAAGYRNERQASESINVKGIQFKKGDMVFVPLYEMGRMPELWEDPDEFIPERFMTDKSLFTMPFGLGPRNCIAQRLALLEIKCAVYKIVSQFQLKIHPSFKTPVTLQKTLFMRPTEKILLQADVL